MLALWMACSVSFSVGAVALAAASELDLSALELDSVGLDLVLLGSSGLIRKVAVIGDGKVMISMLLFWMLQSQGAGRKAAIEC